MPDAPRPTRAALKATDAAVVASARSVVLVAGGASSRAALRTGPGGFVLVAHERLLLIPEWAHDAALEAPEGPASLIFAREGASVGLVVSGRFRRLMERTHTERFRGAVAVLAFEVEAVVAPPRDPEPPPTVDLPESRSSSASQLEVGRVTSVNVGRPRSFEGNGQTIRSGIFKRPVEGPVRVRRLNLEGDGQADLWGHGGSFRAVYAYSERDIAYWSERLDREFGPGTFGENFTVTGPIDDEICVGDVVRVGTALLEVTQPRIPCYKLAAKLGIPGFESTFLKSGRTGFYLRVLREGEVRADDPIVLERRDPRAMTVRAVGALLHFGSDDRAGTERALSIPALSHGWKESFEARVADAGRAPEPVVADEPSTRTFRVASKTKESEVITSFSLRPTDGAPCWPFEPGQFLTFRLSVPGRDEPVIRTYSISQRPGMDDYRISVKRQLAPNGEPGLASSHLHDEVDVGSTLEVEAPRGAFRLEAEGASDVVLLSAGVGLTPLVSMAQHLAHIGSGRRVWFIHGARNGNTHAFAAEMRALAAAHPNLRLHVRYSAPTSRDRAEGRFDSEGRVDLELLAELLALGDYEFYVVGPTPFMRDLVTGLVGWGIDRARIHYEFFGPGEPLLAPSDPGSTAELPPAPADEGGEGALVTFARSDVSARWNGGTLLELAEAHGIERPFSCRSGICGTCATALVQGQVDYPEPPLADPGAGRVLLCVARPRGPVVVDG